MSKFTILILLVALLAIGAEVNACIKHGGDCSAGGNCCDPYHCRKNYFDRLECGMTMGPHSDDD